MSARLTEIEINQRVQKHRQDLVVVYSTFRGVDAGCWWRQADGTCFFTNCGQTLAGKGVWGPVSMARLRKKGVTLEEYSQRMGFVPREQYRRVRNQQWHQANKDAAKKRRAEYWAKHKEILREKHRIYAAERRRTDPAYRIACTLRTRLRAVIKKNKKATSSQTLVGCSWAELIQHLEKKFTPGMTWDNYGQWHIDHVRPLASFDLTLLCQQKEACHYQNLQPLWAADNLKKGAKNGV